MYFEQQTHEFYATQNHKLQLQEQERKAAHNQLLKEAKQNPLRFSFFRR